MPPRIQFTKEHVLQTTFDIMKEQGIEGITARNVANIMGSSVGPIYSHFENIQELQDAALERILELMDDYSRRNWSEIPFLNMGVGFVCFARDEPVLFRICSSTWGTERKVTGIDPVILERMRKDTSLKDLSDEQLGSIFQKMSFMAYGMAVLASNGMLLDDSTENIIKVLMEAGGDIIFMTKARSILGDNNCTEEKLNELWRHLDE